MGSSRGFARKAGVLLLGIAIATTVFATPATALTGTKVTLSKETGGQPTRFTFSTVVEEDAGVSAVTFVYPKKFDLTDVTVRTTLLDGLKRIPVESQVSVSDEELEIRLTPVAPPGSTLRVEMYDVLTTNKGGEYELAVRYTAETTGSAGVMTVQRVAEPVMFAYVSPAAGEEISRWLDGQEWVRQFNSVKVFGLFFKPQLIARAIPMLFMGWLISIALVVLAFPLAIAAGLALAFTRMSKVGIVRWVGGVYINVIRGTPLFLQIFVAFIGLRIAGVRAPDFITGVLVLALNSSAYLAEIFRAGIQSIHKGQFEAASSLGMSYRQSMQYVIIPQTVKRVLPTMTSEFILLFKDTALLAAVGLFELMMRAQNLASRNGNLTPFIVAAVYYLIVTIPLINWVGRLEAHLAVSEHGHSPKEPKGRSGLFWRIPAAVPAGDTGSPSEVEQS
jgi:polar amino acid transport system substrate-binding protein